MNKWNKNNRIASEENQQGHRERKIMQMDKLSTGNLVWYSNKATWNERDKKISLRRRHLYVKNIHNLHGSSKTFDECKYMYIFMAVKNIWS